MAAKCRGEIPSGGNDFFDQYGSSLGSDTESWPGNADGSDDFSSMIVDRCADATEAVFEFFVIDSEAEITNLGKFGAISAGMPDRFSGKSREAIGAQYLIYLRRWLKGD